MPEQNQARGALNGVLEFIAILAAAIIVAYFLQLFVVKPFQIPSESMEHTIDVGDRILVNRVAYRFGSIKRGDIVVFLSPSEPGVDIVKRVIAIGGDTIEVRRGQVILNDVPQYEPYVNPGDTSSFAKITIPPGNVFVMGDNRSNSQDSRFMRPPWLPEDNIIGKAFLIYWPPGRIGTL